MHCPRCGQEQVSGEVRFCKSCGFALNSVREILNPATRDAEAGTNHNTGKGMRQGLMLFLFGMLLIPILMLIPGEIAGIPNLKTLIFVTVMILVNADGLSVCTRSGSFRQEKECLFGRRRVCKQCFRREYK